MREISDLMLHHQGKKTLLPITSKTVTTPPSLSKNDSPNESCLLCQDLGYVLVDNWTARECTCKQIKRFHSRLKQSQIPTEFEQATFATFVIQNKVQKKLHQVATSYVQRFTETRKQSTHSLGFIATVGEQVLRSIADVEKRRQMKRRYNSFGIGKSHLQMAIAKELMKQDYSVMVVSDVAIMDELMSGKRSHDPAAFSKIIDAIMTVPILIWDDLGKANPSEGKKSAYFRVIDERYRRRRPMIYSSNEDIETLPIRIGEAACSRLFGMSQLYPVEGPDYRIFGLR